MEGFYSAPQRRKLKPIQPEVDRILALRPAMTELSDSALRHKTWEFRRRLVEGETLDDLLPEAFAVVREAARRVLGMEHFPVQLIGGIVLHQGRIAEMCTGEGKTLVATLPAYLNALPGEGVHVVTVNDYLAARDMEQMGKVHEFLGLSTGAVLSGMKAEERRRAYRCDVTYVTNHELGFDYLRDNMALDRRQIVQRGLHYAVIDEVDSILIDDARTPLIISGTGERSSELYEACDVLARRMKRGEDRKRLTRMELLTGAEQEESGDYIVEEKEKRLYLTDAGITRTERFFRLDNIADPRNAEIQCHMDLALRANALLTRDRDYVVKDGAVVIVDQSTGRLAPGRRYSDGLHQAIEAKEHVRIQKESRTVATITYQSFFNKYKKIGGMTGTARPEEKEFLETYGMDIVAIPTNRPVLRVDREDVIFRTQREKLEAVCEDVAACRVLGRPVLVGTSSVSASEELSRMLTQWGVPHKVLNAKHDGEEAAIVAEAGRSGAVTIATNMAGRGTDIKLDDQARQAGGLLVIGTERHESQRIDGQLRGRSGRQGDPGESRFYLSLEDPLLRLFGQRQMNAAFDALGVEEGCGVSSPALTKAVKRAQRRVELDHFAQRRRLLEYDQVLNEQREAVYRQRREVLAARDVRKLVTDLLCLAARDAADPPREPAGERRELMLEYVRELLPAELAAHAGGWNEQEFAGRLEREMLERYEFIEQAFGDPAALLERERALLLRAADEKWMRHIDELTQLKQGIGLVSYAQKDPLTEYRAAASRMFDEMNREIRRDTAAAILNTGTDREGGYSHGTT